MKSPLWFAAVAVVLFAAYWLHLEYSRYTIVASEKGTGYKLDRRTGQVWLLDFDEETLVKPSQKAR